MCDDTTVERDRKMDGWREKREKGYFTSDPMFKLCPENC